MITHKSLGRTDETLTYTYDNNGNITHVRRNNVLIARYTYDGMNQLIREDNALLGKSYAITYDTAGNILAKNTFPYTLGVLCCPIDTDEYTYSAAGWKDKLISYNGQSIIYDEIGNPTTYLGHNLTWDRVRQLKRFDSNRFTYDALGRRSIKNSVYYLYDDDKLVKERRNGESLVYYYDTTGICCFRHTIFSGGLNCETFYYYRKNLQGDVTAILDESGTVIAKYTYDAWGNCTITYDPYGIAVLNPIRYRSYYYDTETGLYYLKSRYYDPNIGRFINADNVISGTGESVQGYNLFSYCFNNPINMDDQTGNWPHLSSSVDKLFKNIVTTALNMLVVQVAYACLNNVISSKKGADYEAVDKLLENRKVSANCVKLPADTDKLLYNKENRIYASKIIKEDLGVNSPRTISNISSEIFAHLFFADVVKPLSILSGRIPKKWDIYSRLSSADIDNNEGRIKFFDFIEGVFE